MSTSLANLISVTKNEPAESPSFMSVSKDMSLWGYLSDGTQTIHYISKADPFILITTLNKSKDILNTEYYGYIYLI